MWVYLYFQEENNDNIDNRLINALKKEFVNQLSKKMPLLRENML